jgi:hypothetical protein
MRFKKIVVIRWEETLKRALRQARGVYQRDILLGHQLLSGADLRGAAKSYSGKYKQSIKNLLSRCKEAGLNIYEVVEDHNRRTLVIGTTTLFQCPTAEDMALDPTSPYNDDDH